MTITFEQIKALIKSVPYVQRLPSTHDLVFPESSRERLIQICYDYQLNLEIDYVSALAEFGETRKIEYPKRQLPTSIYGYPIRFDDSVDSVGFVKKD